MTYNISNSGIQGIDYSRMVGFEIIPSGSFTQTDTFKVLADKITEIVKTNLVSMDTSWIYTTTSVAQNVSINDCYSLSVDNNIIQENRLIIYPNPATDIINCTIRNNQNSIVPLSIYNSTGELICTKDLIGSKEIDISDLAPGLYIVRISTDFEKPIKELYDQIEAQKAQ